EGGGLREVDVGAQRVERHAPLAIGFVARHLRAPEPARASHADALGTGAHGRRDRLLHRAAERDALLELLGDVLGHELRVEVRALAEPARIPGLYDPEPQADGVGLLSHALLTPSWPRSPTRGSCVSRAAWPGPARAAASA